MMSKKNSENMERMLNYKPDLSDVEFRNRTNMLDKNDKNLLSNNLLEEDKIKWTKS